MILKGKMNMNALKGMDRSPGVSFRLEYLVNDGTYTVETKNVALQNYLKAKGLIEQ